MDRVVGVVGRSAESVRRRDRPVAGDRIGAGRWIDCTGRDVGQSGARLGHGQCLNDVAAGVVGDLGVVAFRRRGSLQSPLHIVLEGGRAPERVSHGRGPPGCQTGDRNRLLPQRARGRRGADCAAAAEDIGIGPGARTVRDGRRQAGRVIGDGDIVDCRSGSAHRR
ncbi:hypothetical protein D3C72_1410280 [compost metagenome]